MSTNAFKRFAVAFVRQNSTNWSDKQWQVVDRRTGKSVAYFGDKVSADKRAETRNAKEAIRIAAL